MTTSVLSLDLYLNAKVSIVVIVGSSTIATVASTEAVMVIASVVVVSMVEFVGGVVVCNATVEVTVHILVENFPMLLSVLVPEFSGCSILPRIVEVWVTAILR